MNRTRNARRFLAGKVFVMGFIIMGMLYFFLSTPLLFSQVIKPGTTITQKNYSQHEASLKDLTDPSTFLIMKEALESGLVTAPVVETREYPNCKLYFKYTKEYAHTCSIDSRGRLVNYKAGAPFLEPRNALELAYNLDRRESSGDGPATDPVGAFYLFGKGDKEPERTIWWSYYEMHYLGRVRRPPLHEIPGNHGVVDKKSGFIIQKPFDARGFSMIRNRYMDPYRPDEVISYIPAIRRMRRLTGRDTADPLLGMDIIYDDFHLFYQKLTPTMKYEATDRNMLVPSTWMKEEHGGNILIDRNGPYHQIPWEIRPVRCLIIYPNDPDYPYKKRSLVLEKQRIGTMGYSVATYDQAGRLFRGQLYPNVILDSPHYESLSTSVKYINFFTGHSTFLYIPWKSNADLKPEMFTFKSLLRLAR